MINRVEAIIILGENVRAYDIFNEAGLSTKGLMDNPDRLEKFIARMDRSDSKGGKFLTIDGSTVVIDNVPEIDI